MNEPQIPPSKVLEYTDLEQIKKAAVTEKEFFSKINALPKTQLSAVSLGSVALSALSFQEQKTQIIEGAMTRSVDSRKEFVAEHLKIKNETKSDLCDKLKVHDDQTHAALRECYIAQLQLVSYLAAVNQMLFEEQARLYSKSLTGSMDENARKELLSVLQGYAKLSERTASLRHLLEDK